MWCVVIVVYLNLLLLVLFGCLEWLLRCTLVLIIVVSVIVELFA